MLIKEMDLSRLKVHAQQIEEKNLKEKERENKRAKIGSFNFSQRRLEGGNHPHLRQKFSSLSSSLASVLVPKFRNNSRERALGSKSQGNVNSCRTNPLYQKCSRNHHSVCRASSDVYFRYGKTGHKVREYPKVGQQSQNGHLLVPVGCLTQQGTASSGTSEQHQNRLYALQT